MKTDTVCLILLVFSSLAHALSLQEQKIAALAKQMIMQQFYVEEKARADGGSGIKAMRQRGEGTRPYHGTHHSDDYTIMALHDHSNMVQTCGAGEMEIVLNGIDFRTRHNDFLLAQKSLTSKTYGETVIIDYPDTPPSVLAEPTLQKQIKEMQEYFRAWKEQDTSIRNYTSYFKANLCYLEGAWTRTEPYEIQEAFDSRRHQLDAKSWNDLFQKTRFSSYAGNKDNLENYAFLPTTLWDFNETTLDFTTGQWNYRILCHPLKNNLPLNRLRAVDDLKARMSLGLTYDEYKNNRVARFAINPVDQDEFCESSSKFGLLDELMSEIPGMDNYPANINDVAFDNTIRGYDAADDAQPLNVGFYHHWLKNDDNGALGEQTRHRGFNDENMWVAMNTRPNILPARLETCKGTPEVCKKLEQRWSYAIPLEIIYTTPLNKWNPYNIEWKGHASTTAGKTVYQGPGGTVRNGATDPDLAYNGSNHESYYWTPEEFFSSDEIGNDPSDTPRDSVLFYVLDDNNNVQAVRPSGIRTYFPEIPGIGSLRQRYPIIPVHGEGSAVWKELAALADIVMEPKKYKKMIRNPSGTNNCNNAA